MKKNLLTGFFIGLLLSNLMSSSALALGKYNEGSISVSGQSSDSYIPDTAVISFTVETTQKDARKATTVNNQKANKIVLQLKTLLDTTRGDSIKTSAFKVDPVYNYNNKSKKYLIQAYRALNKITVKTKNINDISLLINTAVSNGVDRVENLNFLLEDSNKYCKYLLPKAVDLAKNEATIVANALGVKLNGIKNVSSSCNSSSSRQSFNLRQSEFASKSMIKNTSIEIGEINLFGNVQIEFYLK